METRKAQLLDTVEIKEDIPEYGVRQGEKGVVVEVLDDPDEAYILEFADPSGEALRLAYWIKPDQITPIDELAGAAFERGLKFVMDGKPLEAEREFQYAIDLRPPFIVNLHNIIINQYEHTNDWAGFITALRLVLRLNPSFNVDGFDLGAFARNNLAMAFQNWAAERANDGDLETAAVYFGIALGVESKPETVSLIRRNLARAYTSLGVEAALVKNYPRAVAMMGRACELDLSELSRNNFAVAYARLADDRLRQGDYDGAVTCFEHAIDIGLVLPEVLNNYGYALAKSGNLDEATLVFQRAVKIAPDNQIIRHNLAVLDEGAEIEIQAAEIKAEFPPVAPIQQENYCLAA